MLQRLNSQSSPNSPNFHEGLGLPFTNSYRGDDTEGCEYGDLVGLKHSLKYKKLAKPLIGRMIEQKVIKDTNLT